MNPNTSDTTDERAKLSQPTGVPSYPPPEYSHVDTAEEGDDFNYGYNFEFTEKSIRLGKNVWLLASMIVIKIEAS